jgi:hypothetical protein
MELRREHLEGRIAQGLGHPAAAERHLAVAFRGFLEDGQGLNAADVGLDLALLYLEEGRTTAVKELAEWIAETYAARDVHREAARALELFARAAANERLSVEFVGRLRAYLLQARHDQEKRFQG